MNSESTATTQDFVEGQHARLIKAIEMQGQGLLDDAIALFKTVLEGEPANVPALYSIAVILLNRGDAEQALQVSGEAIARVPHSAMLLFVHATALQMIGNKETALRYYDEALIFEPDNLSVLLNSGVLLREIHRHKDALERFNRILMIDSAHTAALANAAILLTEFKQSEKAIEMFGQLLTLNPDYDYGPGLLCYERLHICDWTDFSRLSKQIKTGVQAGRRACKSLALMAISDSASDHLMAAKTFAQHLFPTASKVLWNGERYRHKRIRLAYVSADLREHPVCHLMAGILEKHDKCRFETYAISLGIDDQSRLRARMMAAFDHFMDARSMSTLQIAQWMREQEIDIAVDLGGYTSDARTGIFAHRAVPVQVNYLGYPGTLGTDYMDYILADRYVIPEDHQLFYTEKVCYLPDAYLPTDNSLQIAERTPTRAECDLPETGFVFCSFNHDYKIAPDLFVLWMRLLKQVPGSVLWLMSRNEISQRNLRQAATEQGVDPERLVFAQRVPLVEDHLARYRQADLFLDTHPYNAHTTAADALMAGLPVLTCMGDAFPARVAGSLLQAIGLPELITHSHEEYEARALQLAFQPEYHAALRARLQANKATHALFDSEGFTRNLEAAYIAMWRKAELGSIRDGV